MAKEYKQIFEIIQPNQVKIYFHDTTSTSIPDKNQPMNSIHSVEIT